MTTRIPQLAAAVAFMATMVSASLPAADAQVDAILKRMRDQLRATMVQVQTAQAETVAVQTQLAESEQKNKDLTAKVESLTKALAEQTKQMAADKAAADKIVNDLNTSIANRSQELAGVNESLAKWKAGYNKVAAIARQKEGERAKLASRVVVLDQKMADRERQNVELYKTGKEILTRYENFGLGNALLAREPFVGTARVKLQTQIQDYQDKLQDQKAKPDMPSANAKTASAPASKKSDAPPAAPAPAGKSTDQKTKS